MKTLRSTAGPFHERPFFSQEEIEQICADELRRAALYPATPGPVRIDRFIEKRFSIVPSYESMGTGILQRRLKTTMAHEVGHCLLHSHLFAMSAGTQSLFGPDSDVVGSKVLCRDEVGGRSTVNHGRYDGRWWEFQANQVMGAILLPKRLVLQCLDPYLCVQGKLGMKVFNSSRREEAVRQLAEVFDVNPAVVRLRLNGLYPLNREANQLSL